MATNSRGFPSGNHGGYTNNYEDFSYASQQYRNSSLSLCFSVTRDVATEAYNFAQPKVKEAKVMMLELKGPECGTGGRMLELKGPECVSGGRRRRQHASRQRRGNRSRSNSTETYGSNDTSYKDNTVTTRETYQGTSSWTVTSWSSNDATSQSLVGARATRSRQPGRGRSPTRRSNSLNAAKNRNKSSNHAMRSTRAISSDCKRLKRNKNEKGEEEEHLPKATPQQKQQGERRQMRLRGSFRHNSFGPEKDQNQAEKIQDKPVCISSQSQILPPPSPKTEPPQVPSTALALSALEDMAIDMVMQGPQEHPCGMLNRVAECATPELQRGSPMARAFPLPPQPPPPPLQSRHQLPKSKVDSGPHAHSKAKGTGALLLPSKLPSSIESGASRNQGMDVTIIVGKGSNQQSFPHNSHVLRYISDYFAQVMKPQTHNPHSSWIVDFSHKNMEEWKSFYPFLEPPVKRTVSVDIHNLPVLLPWFHEFQLPLLLHQCDSMLASLYFPDLEQNPQPEDLQDVLLLLYAALSCDLPQTQTRGIKVLESYLRGAPHLFLPYGGNSSSVSSLQRLIILLQYFPHFCEQLWHLTIRPYLPEDLDAFCDVDSLNGRDWMLANPLFLFVLREGIAKATRLTGSVEATRSQTKQHRFADDDTGTRSSRASTDHAQRDELHNGYKTSRTLAGTLFQEFSDPRSQVGEEERSTNKPSPPVFLEMSYFLGEQFWGGGWNLEPRVSQEKEQRRLEKHKWLEEIVEKLKQHVEDEDKSTLQEPDRGENLATLERSHDEAFHENQDASPRFPNQQPSLHSPRDPRGLLVTREAEGRRGGVRKHKQAGYPEPCQQNEPPPTVNRMRQSHQVTHSSRQAWSKVTPPLGNVVAITPHPMSPSGVSAFMTDESSTDSGKLTFSC